MILEYKEETKQHFTETKGDPKINAPYSVGQTIIPANRTLYLGGTTTTLKQLIERFKDSPEFNALVNAFVTDILSSCTGQFETHSFKLIGAKTNVDRAMDFLTVENDIMEVLQEFEYDQLITGSGYIHKGNISNRRKEIKEIMSRLIGTVLKKTGKKIQVKDFPDYFMKAVDEDINTTTQLITVPSSQMDIKLDNNRTKVIGYAQQVLNLPGSENIVPFEVKDIIHQRWLKLNGDPLGWSPFKSLMREDSMIKLIKDFNGTWFHTGGTGDKMFIFEEAHPESPHVKQFKEDLKVHRDPNMKRGNIVLTSKVNVIDTGVGDIQYRDLALYLTSIMGATIGIPPARVPFFVREGGTTGQTDDLSMQGYYRNVAYRQTRLEDVMNAQLLWPEFKVRIAFHRGYLQDNIRKTQERAQAAAVIEQSLNWIKKNKRQEYVSKMLSIPIELVDENPEPAKSGMLNQNFNRDKNIFKEEAKLNQDKAKQDQAIGV